MIESESPQEQGGEKKEFSSEELLNIAKDALGEEVERLRNERLQLGSMSSAELPMSLVTGWGAAALRYYESTGGIAGQERFSTLLIGAAAVFVFLATKHYRKTEELQKRALALMKTNQLLSNQERP